MDVFLKRLANLLSVKSLISMLLTIVFCVITMRGLVSAELFMTIFATEKALKDLGEKVSEDEKKDTEKLIEELKKSLEGNNTDEIKEKTKALNEKAMSLATKVYEEAAKANANNNNAGGSEEPKAEEAEFVNK